MVYYSELEDKDDEIDRALAGGSTAKADDSLAQLKAKMGLDQGS